MSAVLYSIDNIRKIPVRNHHREIRRSEQFKATHTDLMAYVRAKKDEAHIVNGMLELEQALSDALARDPGFAAHGGIV